MKIRVELVLSVCICFKLLGVTLFLRGFFSVKKSVDGYATFADQSTNPLSDMAKKQLGNVKKKKKKKPGRFMAQLTTRHRSRPSECL